MNYQTISCELTDGVAVVTLNRPDKMNSLTSQMRIEITQAIRALEAEARVIVLTGAGPAFCAGQDLADGGNVANIDVGAVLRDEYVPMLKAITECPLPTIAAVGGPAVGAGASLALACDVVMAAQGAYFTQAFSKIGLIPDAGATYFLPRQIGLSRAMGAALFADKISADQARDWGMIYETAPDEEFETHWRSRAAQLATGPTLTYGYIKEAIRSSLASDLEQQLETEAHFQTKAAASDDFKEGVVAFLQKRAPSFQGR